MPEPATKPAPKGDKLPDDFDPTKEFEGPPEEEFWERYNRRLEFPLSSVATVLLHVLVGTIIVLILLKMESKEDRSSVDVKFMSVNGMDDYGAGSPGSGGREDPIVEKMNEDPATAIERMLGDPAKLPEIKEKMAKLIDPTGNLPITAGNALALESLDKTVRDKLFGARRGTGGTPGSGVDGAGSGPGGSGADSTLGRNLRWTLRFQISSSADYLRQLQTMGAAILIPKPGTDQVVVIEDISRPENRRTVGPEGLGKYADRIRFNDARPDVVGSMARTLQLDFTPKLFCAAFTKELEEDLRRKEVQFQNKRAEQIEETVFKVSVSGGSYRVTVERQKLR